MRVCVCVVHCHLGAGHTRQERSVDAAIYHVDAAIYHVDAGIAGLAEQIESPGHE